MGSLSHRALPGYIVDLITEGVPEGDIAARGDPAVFGALLSSAMSAQQREWTLAEWWALVETRRLGAQVRTKRGKPRPCHRAEKLMLDAWDRAAQRIKDNPPAFDADEARSRVDAVRSAIADAGAKLSSNERAVLAVAANAGDRLGTVRPALAQRTVAAESGLSLPAVRKTLARLERRGVLQVAERGRRGAASRMATCYRLPTSEEVGAHLLRGEPVCAPPTHRLCAPTPPLPSSPLALLVRPPSTDPRESVVVTLTLTTRDPAALAEAIRQLAGRGLAEPTTAEFSGDVGQVVPLHAHRAGQRDPSASPAASTPPKAG